VVCTSEPCALSLVTTLGVGDDDRSEGFCVRLSDGTVACWGANGTGQLGRGDDAGIEDDPTPARVVGVTGVVALDHTCAIDGSGSVHCWGTGPFLRDDAGVATTERTPVKLPLPPVTNIGVGETTACAASADGVVCWGRNDHGQVAPFGSAPRFDALTPSKVALPTGVAPRSLAVDRASFVIGEDGVMVSWGANPPLARASSLSPDPYPLAVALAGVSSLDVARDNACATAGGTGYCWGAAPPKDLDPEDVTLLLRALPTPVVTPEPITRIATTRNIVVENLGTRIVQPQRWCACGRSGAVFCAGYNASGQAGDGTKAYAYEAVKVVGLPGPAADVKATPDATCALLTSGKVYCWGSDFYGQLGTGEMKVPSLVPQEVRLP
ncbi:MAG: hypothetical protein K0S65_6699, partial [Labilithrix sp.]|nr:hypothetical protein [Labilithrix sp.]